MTLSDQGQVALGYASRNWPVIPLHAPREGGCSCGRSDCTSIGKHPRTAAGLKDASTDSSVIEKWWTQWPDANVGLRTGVWCDVLDLDSAEAVREFEQLVIQHGGTPELQPYVHTSKGKHYYYAPTGIGAPVKFKPGWDWRGQNALVVAPPSHHASGFDYIWGVNVNGALPVVSDWLLQLLRQKPRTDVRPGTPIPEGGRNAAMASLAGVMRRKGMSPSAIEAALLEENRARCQPPLSDAEVAQIAASVGRYKPAIEAAPSIPLDPDELELVTAAELCSDDEEEVDSIIPGFLVPGSITEIDAAVKAGKTTLEMAAIRAIVEGGEFLGRRCLQGAVVLISEESRPSLKEALRRARLTDCSSLYVICGMATRRHPWPALVAGITNLAEPLGVVALMVDTLGTLAGLGADEENDAGAALAAILPLRTAADAGLGIWISRHDRKSGGAVGESGRGSSAFAGAVDTIFTLRRLEDGMSPNVRQLKGVSRFSDCPSELDVEWTDDGYVSRGDPAIHAAQSQDLALMAALPVGTADACSSTKLSECVPKLSPRRARERLEDLVFRSQIGRIGAGRKGDPYLYYAFYPQKSEMLAKIPADSGETGLPESNSISDIPANALPPETPESLTPDSPPEIPAEGTPYYVRGGPLPPESSHGVAPEVQGLTVILEGADSVEALRLLAQHWRADIDKLPDAQKVQLRDVYRRRVNQLVMRHD